MAAEAAARALARRLAALPEGPIRARAAARAVARGDPEATALALAALARSTEITARTALLSVGQAFLDPGAELSYAARAALYAAATEHGLTEVTSLLLSPPPVRPWSPPRDPPDARLAHLSLGHKKALARAQKDPDLLSRLGAEGAPEVVRELLQNPQLTEAFAIRIAARRPCRPETLRLLAESRRWRTQPAVARAVARNPYTEPAVALKLLGFLATADLSDLARDGAVHPLVKALAARLSRARGAG
jgi:transglutaminase-like putative cysteine protease